MLLSEFYGYLAELLLLFLILFHLQWCWFFYFLGIHLLLAHLATLVSATIWSVPSLTELPTLRNSLANITNSLTVIFGV